MSPITGRPAAREGGQADTLVDGRFSSAQPAFSAGSPGLRFTLPVFSSSSLQAVQQCSSAAVQCSAAQGSAAQHSPLGLARLQARLTQLLQAELHERHLQVALRGAQAPHHDALAGGDLLVARVHQVAQGLKAVGGIQACREGVAVERGKNGSSGPCWRLEAGAGGSAAFAG